MVGSPDLTGHRWAMRAEMIGLKAGLRRWAGSPFLRSLSRFSASAAASQAMMMVYALLVARALGPDLFGKFSGSYALVGLSGIAVNWGMDTWLLRDPGSLASPRIWAGRVLRIKASIGLVWGAGLVFLAPLIRPDTFSPLLVFIVVLDVWFDSALNTHIAGLTIQKRFVAISRLLFFSRALRLLGALALVILGIRSPLVFALARFAATSLGLGVGFLVFKPLLASLEGSSNRAVLRTAALFGLSEFLAVVYMQADVSMLSILSGSTAAGLYSPASGFVNALFVIPSSVFMIAVPALSRQFASEPTRLPGSILRVSLGFLALGLVLSGGMVLAGGWLIRLLLGSHYLVTSALVVILAPLLLFKSLGFGWAAVLISVDWQKQRLFPQALSAGLNVLLNLWAIPHLGVPGVAVVYTVSEFILALGYGGLVLLWLRRRAHLKEGGSG